MFGVRMVVVAVLFMQFVLTPFASADDDDGDYNSIVNVFSVSDDVNRFFKLAYSMVEKGDVKTLAVKLSPEYKKLCVKMGGCSAARKEVISTLQEKINTLQIHWYKMERLQAVFNRIIPDVSRRRRRSRIRTDAAATQSQMAL
jgi:hypothetical protein